MNQSDNAHKTEYKNAHICAFLYCAFYRTELNNQRNAHTMH